MDFSKKGKGILIFLNVQNDNFLIVHFPQIIFISISSLYELQIALCQVYVANSKSEENYLLEKLVCFKLHLVPALFIVLLSYFSPFMTCY